MEILFLLVPVALILIGLAIKLLFWAVKNGQYDDLNTEGSRILFDDDAESLRPTTDSRPEAMSEKQAETRSEAGSETVPAAAELTDREKR
ncbi:cbb3-type cytochrome oxidase assembly protein CcoS [Simiduia aestuariiviva]|uniref:Cbb3-type cytochrome oxidase maturation protein n=1 Tax=Simiduia aestuariiviva TaxID=1510459 RepID=A0A839UV43_9GAMM|nr:cbb3-type cytochrome oxidase assembly protein CcoS [Simiduia aestuariiviva]MBB3169348.1 cbb3-type cytochrome oxidase maturation protein [Simiduia aestuariiviva]